MELKYKTKIPSSKKCVFMTAFKRNFKAVFDILNGISILTAVKKACDKLLSNFRKLKKFIFL